MFAQVGGGQVVGQNRLNQAVGELVRDICGMEPETIQPFPQSNKAWVFLDTDHDWILAHGRRELVAALLEYLDPNDDDTLLRLVAACLNCSEEDITSIGP